VAAFFADLLGLFANRSAIIRPLLTPLLEVASSNRPGECDYNV